MIPIAKRYPGIFTSSDTYANIMKKGIFYSNLVDTASLTISSTSGST